MYWVLAVPSDVADGCLSAAGDRTVIDMSGALKRSGRGRYGLVREGRLLDGGVPRRGDRLANPGCFASSVIVGLHNANLAEPGAIVGPIQVVAVGGASTAHRSQQGGIRLARRQLDHPHVAEIQQTVPDLILSQFSLMVAYAQPHGILTVIRGSLSTTARPEPGKPAVDVNDVVDSAVVVHSLVRNTDSFTLGVALCNLTFPAANAVKLLDSLPD